MPQRLQGKVALVTGAGSGIGRASALAYAKEGARVAVSDIDIVTAERTVEGIKAGGGDAIAIQCNVTRADDVRAMFGRVLEAYGRLDCALNNAGIEGSMAPMDAYDESMFDRVMAVNMKGVWLCMKQEAKVMLPRGGAVVNMCSVVGMLGQPDMCAYVASKHAVLGLTRSAALEYADRGLRFNAVCPAIVATAMLERFTGGRQELVQGLTASYPIKRVLEAEEVAESVIWLSTDASSYLNGHALVLDGGFSIQ